MVLIRYWIDLIELLCSNFLSFHVYAMSIHNV